MTAYPADDEVFITLDHVTYNVSTLDLLDENIRTTNDRAHHDALLDARDFLYPSRPRLSPHEAMLKAIRQAPDATFTVSGSGDSAQVTP